MFQIVEFHTFTSEYLNGAYHDVANKLIFYVCDVTQSLLLNFCFILNAVTVVFPCRFWYNSKKIITYCSFCCNFTAFLATIIYISILYFYCIPISKICDHEKNKDFDKQIAAEPNNTHTSMFCFKKFLLILSKS